MPWTIEGVDRLVTQDKHGTSYKIQLPYAGDDPVILQILEDNGAVKTLAPRDTKAVEKHVS